MKLVCEVVGVSRRSVLARLSRSATWRDGRQSKRIDDDAGYTADGTHRFAVTIGLNPLTTSMCCPQSNGMAASFVKTMKRNRVAFMPRPDAATAARNLTIVFEHDDERHSHRALKSRSPCGFRRSMNSATFV